MSNHLKDQSSPYLLQHAENPVNWYPWCEEAFTKAREEERPIFLSIGYSTCHWCHVMAHESFEDEEIAGILNQYFVSIKVDREERPDIDSVYMSVCQALTGSGGWPMSIFLTAEQRPFFAGTYFPPRSQQGGMGFRELLLAMAQQWKSNRESLIESANEILAYISREQPQNKENDFSVRSSSLPERAADLFARSFDKKWGGFGNAPKFPTPHNLIFLMLYAKVSGNIVPLEQARTTLIQMRRGGIFDHIGYGFSRYSTDRYYLVPHFEKMLYDNALLIIAYAAAYKMEIAEAGAGGSRDIFLGTAEKIADYIMREMTSPQGAFYSAQDADSEGREGSYYVWSWDEVCHVLGKERGERSCAYYGITAQGNFEGKNIPNLLNGNEFTEEFEEERRVLYEYRKSQRKLSLDDKILTSWNSLMICAMTILYRTTGNVGYLQAAEHAYRYIERYLAEGMTLFVSCRDGVRSVSGFLDDYACYAAALISLYEANAGQKYLERAKQICQEAQRRFTDGEGGGYYLYGVENAGLILRPTVCS